MNYNDILIKEEKSHKQPLKFSNVEPMDSFVFNQNFDDFSLSDEEYEASLKFINEYATKKGYIELMSDYLCIDHYYYDNKTKRMYKVTP